MKRTIFALLTLVLLIPAPASAKDVKKDDWAKVPSWTWVEVKNTERIKNSNISFEYGDRCGIQEGGTVTVVGIDANRVLLHYSSANALDILAGTSCPTGVLFFTTKDEFSKMNAKYRKAIDARVDEQNLVQRLTKK